MTQKALSIGGAAGFSNDRPEGGQGLAAEFAAAGGPAVIMFETLAERTLALAQQVKAAYSEAGYEPQLGDYLGPILKTCLDNSIAVVGNFGAANPAGAARRIQSLARGLNLAEPVIGVVAGDDLLETMSPEEVVDRLIDGDETCTPDNLVSANVYLGAAPIAEALDRGAEVVVTGRVADPALALGPLVNFHGWAWDDWDRLAAGTLAGHLLECGTQVSGGYFADPGFKDVADPAWIGYPIGRVDQDGRIEITKPKNSGGLVSRQTVIEQMLYEIHDPAAYLTPDVVLDITGVEVEEIGENLVRLSGARGKPRPETLKATVGFNNGFLGEGEISYAGINAAARGRLALDILRERMTRLFPDCKLRTDLIGLSAVLNDDNGAALAETRARTARGQGPPGCSVARSGDRRTGGQGSDRPVLLRPGRRGRGEDQGHPPAEDRLGPDSPRSGLSQTDPDRRRPMSRMMNRTKTVPLHRIAHGRTGDKGNRSNISVIAYDQADYPILVEQVTEDRIRRLFAHRNPTKVTRYLLPKVGAMNFVIDDVLEGGVNSSLNLDGHGKALAFAVLALTVEVPAE